MATNDDAAELVEAIVMVARAMNKHSAPHFIGLNEDLKLMVTTQEEHGDGLSWWVRLLNGANAPIQSWHAEGMFGLLNAATQVSLRVYPYRRKL